MVNIVEVLGLGAVGASEFRGRGNVGFCGKAKEGFDATI